MKNFFKKLSFVMALALVLTSLAPAGAAQAASAMVMNVSEKILYITENAKNTPDNYDFYIKNKPEDWRSTLDFEWESSDETVATVENGGITQAHSVGVTTISCTITDSETGEEVAFTTCELTVKGIADRIEIINAPEDGIVGIGENVIDLNRAMYDEAGNRTTQRGVYVSDYTRWISSDETIATVDKNGVVTTYKEGEFTITAETYQSKANPGTNASVSVTLTAQPSMVSATQKSITKAELVFDADMSDVITKDNLIVSSIVGTTPVKQIVKSVSFDESGRVATVEVYVNFAPNTEYTFAYNDMTAGFVGADLSIENVASIAISTQTAIVNEATEIKVVLYDANGIEIAYDNSGRIDLSAPDSSDYWMYGDEITFFESGRSALVTAVFHTYDYDPNTGVEAVIETVGTIYSITAATGIDTVQAYHVGESAPSSWNASDVSHRLSTSDVSGYNFYVRAVDVNGTTRDSEPGAIDDGFTFESSDSGILIVGQEGDIYPVRTGSVNVIVRYDGVVVAALPVTIIGDRVTTSLDVTLSRNTLSSYEFANDSITMTVTATDQLGASTIKNANSVKLEALGNNHPYTQQYLEMFEGFRPSNDKFVFTSEMFSGVEATTYQYRVTVGNLSKVVSFRVDTPDSLKDEDATARIVLPTEADLAFDFSDATKTYDFVVEPGVALYAPNGYKLKDVDSSKIVCLNTMDTELGLTTVQETAKNNSGEAVYHFSINTNLDRVTLTGAGIQLFAVSGSGIQKDVLKASAGTVRVVLYSTVYNTKADSYTVSTLSSSLFTIKDSQTNPTVTVKKNTFSSTEQIVPGFGISSDVFTVNNGNIANVVYGEVIGAETSRPFIRTLQYITNVTVNGITYRYVYDIPVNQSFIVEN